MEPGRLLEAGKTEGSFKREHVSVGHGRLSVGFGSGQAWVLDGPCGGRGRGRAGLSSGGRGGEGGEGGGWRVRDGDRETGKEAGRAGQGQTPEAQKGRAGVVAGGGIGAGGGVEGTSKQRLVDGLRIDD